MDTDLSTSNHLLAVRIRQGQSINEDYITKSSRFEPEDFDLGIENLKDVYDYKEEDGL